MPLVKLYSATKNKSAKTLSADLKTSTICTYYFSVIWNKSSICNLYLLNGRTKGGVLHQIITKMVSDSDGEITIEIGKFVKGTVVDLFFGLQAVTKIDNLRIIITNATEKSAVRVLPKKDTDIKKLEKGETYDDQIAGYALH